MKTLVQKDIKNFLSFEKEQNLNLIRYKNKKIWPLIRWSVYDAILSSQGKAQRAVSTTKISKRPSVFKKFFRLLESFLSFYNLFGNTDILLFNYGRVLEFKEKKDNLLVWTFSEALNENYSLTTVDQYNIYPTGSRNIINICELLSMISYVASFFVRFTNWVQLENEVNHKIKQSYNLDVQLRQIYVSNFIYQKSIGILSKFIIKIKKPKVIIYSDTGSFSEVIYLAKLNGLKTIDYQHALQSGQNLLYAHNPDTVRDYEDYLSDYVMTFGEYWNKYFDNNYKAIAVGSSYQELMNEEIQKYSKEGNSIIFISDGEMARKEFEGLAIAIAKRIPEIQIYYKLRPDEFLEWTKLYSKEVQQVKNIKFIDNNDKSLHSYFKKCKYVIGINSTALIEALTISNVIVHKKGWYIEMEDFIKNDYVLSSSNLEDILEIIEQKKIPKRSINKEMLFKSECKRNIRASIDEIFRNKQISR